MRKLKFGKIFAVMTFFIIVVVVSILSVSQAKAASITVLSPNGGESWKVGETHRITWAAVGVEKVTMYLYDDRITSSGAIVNYPVLDNQPISASQGYYDWTILPNVLQANDGKNFTIIVQDANDYRLSDESDASFSIMATGTPSITVLSPNGGETWVKGTKQTIKWQDNTPVPACPAGAECMLALNSYDIKLVKYYPPCIDQGNGLTACTASAIAPYTIAENVSNTSYSWTVGVIKDLSNGLAPDGSYLIHICQTGSTTCDSSDSYFKIVTTSAPSIAVTSPNGGETWAKETKQTIKWQDNTPLPTCTGSTSPDVSSTCAAARSYDINLVTYSAPCSVDMACVQSIPAIYKIAKNIQFNYYNWTVGAIQNLYDGLAPEGSYTIQICQSGTNTCDSSDSYFKIANQSKVCTACVGGKDTGKKDLNGCAIYSCPTPTCSTPVCKVGFNSYYTGKVDANGCKIYLCPEQACKTPVCEVGSKFYYTGKVDADGCKAYLCQEINSSIISEQVKCVFKGSQTEGKCYLAGENDKYYCSGQETCVIDVAENKGEKLTWKSTCGGYAYTVMDGQNEYAEFDCSVQGVEMVNNAKDVIGNKYDSILSELKLLRDTVKEQQNEIKYLKSMTSDLRNVSDQMKSAINDFITYGVDTNTVKLGAGERAAVINSYKAAFAKLPETEAELTDAIKIANGRFPSLTSDTAEKAANDQFIKIYKRIPDLNNPKDNAAIKVMAYGLRQKAENRNLNSEKVGIKTFKDIYGYTPGTTEEWNTMQAITYSGAVREKDADGDLLSDEMEAQYGTDPNKADTDGDGYKDGVEVNSGYNPKGEGKL